MWFVHELAPANFHLQVRKILNRQYHNHWIGRTESQSWPPRSPNLSSLDFFCGDILRRWFTAPQYILTRSCESTYLIAYYDIIRYTLGIFQRVRDSMSRRAEACILAGGGHFFTLISSFNLMVKYICLCTYVY